MQANPSACHAHRAAHIENSMHETEKIFGPFRSFQLQAESGSCVVLSGHLAAMVGPPGRPGGVEVGYPPRTPAQARVYAAPGDVPVRCPRGPRGYRSMVRVAIGSAIHHFSLFQVSLSDVVYHVRSCDSSICRLSSQFCSEVVANTGSSDESESLSLSDSIICVTLEPSM